MVTWPDACEQSMFEHTAGQSCTAFPVWFHQGLSLCVTSGTILMTGRVYASFKVLRVTTQTFLSGPEWICSIWAKVHLVGCDSSSLTHTMSFTLVFGDELLHLANCWRLIKYSCDQCCHRWCVTTWQRCQMSYSSLQTAWVLIKYSRDQRCHRWHITNWQRCHRCNDDMGLDGSDRSGKASKGCLIRKWPGVRTSIPSSVGARCQWPGVHACFYMSQYHS